MSYQPVHAKIGIRTTKRPASGCSRQTPRLNLRLALCTPSRKVHNHLFFFLLLRLPGCAMTACLLGPRERGSAPSVASLSSSLKISPFSLRAADSLQQNSTEVKACSDHIVAADPLTLNLACTDAALSQHCSIKVIDPTSRGAQTAGRHRNPPQPLTKLLASPSHHLLPSASL